MKRRYRLQRIREQVCHPFVWIGGVFFLVLSLISRWIGGNPRPLLVQTQIAVGVIEQIVWTLLWGASVFLNGASFGAMFALTDRRCLLRANRTASLIILLHLLTLFAYPLFFVCYAWLLTFLLLFAACIVCGGIIFTVRRVSWLVVWAMLVHIALLLWTIVRLGSIIFMN